MISSQHAPQKSQVWSQPCCSLTDYFSSFSCFILAFCHVDSDVCIYSTCAFFLLFFFYIVKWILMLNNVQCRELVIFLGGIALYKSYYYYY